MKLIWGFCFCLLITWKCTKHLLQVSVQLSNLPHGQMAAKPWLCLHCLSRWDPGWGGNIKGIMSTHIDCYYLCKSGNLPFLSWQQSLSSQDNQFCASLITSWSQQWTVLGEQQAAITAGGGQTLRLVTDPSEVPFRCTKLKTCSPFQHLEGLLHFTPLLEKTAPLSFWD